MNAELDSFRSLAIAVRAEVRSPDSELFEIDRQDLTSRLMELIDTLPDADIDELCEASRSVIQELMGDSLSNEDTSELLAQRLNDVRTNLESLQGNILSRSFFEGWTSIQVAEFLKPILESLFKRAIIILLDELDPKIVSEGKISKNHRLALQDIKDGLEPALAIIHTKITRSNEITIDDILKVLSDLLCNPGIDLDAAESAMMSAYNDLVKNEFHNVINDDDLMKDPFEYINPRRAPEYFNADEIQLLNAMFDSDVRFNDMSIDSVSLQGVLTEYTGEVNDRFYGGYPARTSEDVLGFLKSKRLQVTEKPEAVVNDADQIREPVEAPGSDTMEETKQPETIFEKIDRLERKLVPLARDIVESLVMSAIAERAKLTLETDARWSREIFGQNDKELKAVDARLSRRTSGLMKLWENKLDKASREARSILGNNTLKVACEIYAGLLFARYLFTDPIADKFIDFLYKEGKKPTIEDLLDEDVLSDIKRSISYETSI